MKKLISFKNWPHKKIALILNVFFFTVLMILFSLIFFFNHGLINVTGYGIYQLRSDSMEPVLNEGDTVLIHKTSMDALNAGDIIVFETNLQKTSVPITERVVVIHYFETFEDGIIYTYSELTKNETDETLKYDTWGTTSSPYFVGEDDILGIYIQTINIYNFLFIIFGMGLFLMVYRYKTNQISKD